MAATETQTAPVLNGIGDGVESKHHDVGTTINYLAIPEDGSEPVLEDLSNKTLRFLDARKVTVRDVRGLEGSFKLDKNGFEYLHNTAPLIDFQNDETVKQVHYPLMEQFLKEHCGASKVKIFNHIVRNAPANSDGSRANYKGPAQRPHVDSAAPYIPEMLENNFGVEEAASMLSRRHAIINMWRPLKTVRRDPLGVCDARTVPQEDFHLFTYNKATFETTKKDGRKGAQVWFTKAGKKDVEHKWYYLHGQTPEEVLFFKIFDSTKEEGIAKTVSHSSFEVEGMEDKPVRESIELRAVVCW